MSRLINFNHSARRKTSAFTCLLLAIVMLLAGLFVSAPAQAADPNTASVSVDIANQTITYKQSYSDAPLVLFVVTDARGAHNVQVPNDNVGKTETFGPEWGTSANVRFLDPITEQFKVLGDYDLSSPVVTPPPPVQTVTFCQATGDSSNPYTRLTIPVTVFFEAHVNDVNNIVPSITYVVRGNVVFFPGFNWDDAGRAIFNNNCIPLGGTPPTETPTPDPLPDDTDRKIGICHATHPRAEAYESIDVPIAAILAGHGQHEGDIIPSFSYVKQGLAGGYPGNRWDAEGQKIFNNGCTVIPVHTPTPTETTEPTETAEPTPAETETESATPVPTKEESTAPVSAVPSASQEAIPAGSKTAAVTTKVSRYPAAVVDTAVKGEGNTPTSSIALLLFGGAAIALLMSLLLFRSAGYEGRRH